MFSMTGYGKGEYRKDGIELTVEMKSVNNRFLDLNLKTPRVFAANEEEVRALLRENLHRGHVDVFINYNDKREKEKHFTVDAANAKAYYAAAQEIKNTLPDLRDDVSVSFFLRLPDVVSAEVENGADEALVTALKEALSLAVAGLKRMRRAEGERLKKVLLSGVEAVKVLRDKIALRAPQVAENYRKKLTERMQELLSGKADEGRILTEAAVYSDKCNIDEELSRLVSHIEEFYKICEEEYCGRKLDFLIQEFNRECNTICSKSNDAEVTGFALQMKNEIEKIREQVQNIE